ncbi:MAG: UbiA family prenyltransferase [Flavobacteriales bacterium]|jgi:4-hydroxybenzoate polyprenyltransferase|nr:UbiA family prenyltransferase [Flavobacteriales bacterium]NCG29498.1 hypothetical protein [Bacteroidota bacterium]MBT3963928.1 UbiA family prenyltransferase [Flavobacteriales bacterium]MBT4705629.1 UbiA family prenyltransferase [Flavobacteriales bacterium]MBT4931168.1 UbiA family prenyltransferase [Flavobacteriales bacterium]
MVEKLKQIIAFIRLGNLALIALYYFVFDTFLLWPIRVHVAQEPVLSPDDFNLLLLDVILVTVIGYWLNDWRDRAADKKNRPDRFLVKNEIKLGGFLILIGIPVIVGALITLHLGIKTGNEKWTVLYPVVLILLTVYAYRGKQMGLAGNVLVSMLIASLPALLIIAERDLFNKLKASNNETYLSIVSLLMVYGSLMFFSNLARELVKDCEDLEGDTEVGSRSFPIQYGLPLTRWLISANIFLALVAQGFFVFQMANENATRIVAMVISMLLISSFWLLFRGKVETNFRVLSQGLKLTMLLGIVQLAIYMLLEYSQIN